MSDDLEIGYLPNMQLLSLELQLNVSAMSLEFMTL